jgi:hypothetical protein
MSEGAVPVGRQTMRRCVRSVKDLLNSEARWRALTLAVVGDWQLGRMGAPPSSVTWQVYVLPLAGS